MYTLIHLGTNSIRATSPHVDALREEALADVEVSAGCRLVEHGVADLVLVRRVPRRAASFLRKNTKKHENDAHLRRRRRQSRRKKRFLRKKTSLRVRPGTNNLIISASVFCDYVLWFGLRKND